MSPRNCAQDLTPVFGYKLKRQYISKVSAQNRLVNTFIMQWRTLGSWGSSHRCKRIETEENKGKHVICAIIIQDKVLNGTYLLNLASI
jgi:hypothetical protein